MQEPANFGPTLSFDFLHRKADLPDNLARLTIDHQPQPVSILGISLHLSVQPMARIFARESAFVVARHVWIGQHVGHEIQVGRLHFTKRKSVRFKNGSHLQLQRLKRLAHDDDALHRLPEYFLPRLLQIIIHGSKRNINVRFTSNRQRDSTRRVERPFHEASPGGQFWLWKGLPKWRPAPI
jgi:hypothetical protein